MGLYSKLKTSPKLEQEGTWLDMGELRIRCAFAGNSNKAFVKASADADRKYRKLSQNDMLPFEKEQEIIAGIYADHIVRDWETLVGDEWQRGIEGPNGDILEFNRENVVMTFRNLPMLLRAVRDHAESIETYRAELIKDVAGN